MLPNCEFTSFEEKPERAWVSDLLILKNEVRWFIPYVYENSRVEKIEPILKIRERIAKSAETEATVKLPYSLYNYQKKGVNFICQSLKYNRGVILGDEMGLGKTVQAIAVVKALKPKKTLIITRASILPVWEEHLKKWLGVTVKADEPNGKILLTAYSRLDKILQPPNSKFNLIIADEAHALKNPRTKTRKLFKTFLNEADNLLLLTGTPIYNQPIDFYYLLELVCPFRFSLKTYLSYFFYLAYIREGGRVKAVKNMLPERFIGFKFLGFRNERKRLFQKNIHDVYLARTLKEVYADIPEPIEIVRVVKMKPGQERVYVKAVKELIIKLQKEKLPLSNFLVEVLRLKQLSLSPYLLEPVEANKYSPKLEELQEMIEAQEITKALLFTQFRNMAKLTSEMLNIPFITGELPVQKRKELLFKFDSEKEGFLVATIDSIGEGYHLKKCNTVVFIDIHPFIPSKNSQAKSRIRDIETRKPSRIIYLETEKPKELPEGVEQTIEKLINHKIKLTREALWR